MIIERIVALILVCQTSCLEGAIGRRHRGLPAANPYKTSGKPLRTSQLVGIVEAFEDVADGASHVEVLLRDIVEFAIQNAAETLNRVFEGDITSRPASEALGHKHGLREEVFDLTGA